MLAAIAGFAMTGSAAAAPVMCTDHDADPQGITATHLFANIDGKWVEPQNVCVGARVEEKDGVRGLYLGVWNTVDGGFPETHLPPGTEISLGLHFPDTFQLGQTFGRWRDGVVVTDGADTVIQAETVGWDYHAEAFFGGPGLDCNKPPVVWPSTFTAYSSLDPPGKPELFAGAFYGSNTVGALFPSVQFDADGALLGLEAQVQGCGDHDPSTLEGYFNGFMPLATLRSYGISDQMLHDLGLLQGMLQVYDLTSKTSVLAKFQPVGPGGLKLDPIPGVTMPSPPSGPGLVGVRTESEFSYSGHDLLQRAEPSAKAAMQTCRAKGGTPAAARGGLTCAGVAAVPLRATLARGRVVRCNHSCRATATLVGDGARLATGRAHSGTKLQLRPTAAGRKLLKAKRKIRSRLTVIVTDDSGGWLSLRRTLGFGA